MGGDERCCYTHGKRHFEKHFFDCPKKGDGAFVVHNYFLGDALDIHVLVSSCILGPNVPLRTRNEKLSKVVASLDTSPCPWGGSDSSCAFDSYAQVPFGAVAHQKALFASRYLSALEPD